MLFVRPARRSPLTSIQISRVLNQLIYFFDADAGAPVTLQRHQGFD